MHAVIPAGGRGIRLRPLTNSIPKPLLPLGDRAILSRIVDNLPPGVPATVLVTPELAGDFDRWRLGYHSPRTVHLYVEKSRPGDLKGPLVALAEFVQDTGCRDDLLIMMGDSILPFTSGKFLTGADPNHLRLAAYRMPDISDASRFGVLEIGTDESVMAFTEKPARPTSPWVFTGCLHLPARLLPELQRAAMLGLPQMGHLVGHFVERGELVSVFRVAGEWHDIGNVTAYLEAHRALLSQRESDILISRGNRLEGVVYAHPSAQISGSSLRNSVVFAGAEIVKAELTNCVVMARTLVRERAVHGMLIASDTELSLY